MEFLFIPNIDLTVNLAYNQDYEGTSRKTTDPKR
jgi:hypothetical protein